MQAALLKSADESAELGMSSAGAWRYQVDERYTVGTLRPDVFASWLLTVYALDGSAGRLRL